MISPIGAYTRIQGLNPSVYEVLEADRKQTRPQTSLEVVASDFRKATPGVQVTISDEAQRLYRAMNTKGE
jgi:hypothetical protein